MFLQDFNFEQVSALVVNILLVTCEKQCKQFELFFRYYFFRMTIRTVFIGNFWQGSFFVLINWLNVSFINWVEGKSKKMCFRRHRYLKHNKTRKEYTNIQKLKLLFKIKATVKVCRQGNLIAETQLQVNSPYATWVLVFLCRKQEMRWVCFVNKFSSPLNTIADWFSPVNCPNVDISHPNFLLFSCNPFATLL